MNYHMEYQPPISPPDVSDFEEAVMVRAQDIANRIAAAAIADLGEMLTDRDRKRLEDVLRDLYDNTVLTDIADRDLRSLWED